MNLEYIHSFTETEQDRLISQAKFLAPYTHPFLAFNPDELVLEIGCGVGAQIKLLINSHSFKKIIGIDSEPKQIAKAQFLLSKEINLGKVEVAVSSGTSLPYPDNSFDSVYIFFVLEHFEDPKSIIKEVRRVLKPAGKFYCTEVFNSGIYIYPENKFLMNYWNKFNQLQYEIGGNPDIGIHLTNLCLESELTIEKFNSVSPMLDRRLQTREERAYFLNMWESLFLSGYSLLLSKNRIHKNANKRIPKEFEKIKNNLDSIFLYSAGQILAIKKTEMQN